jgi:protease-4
MSEAQREVINAILDETFEYLIATIAEKRGITRAAVSDAIDRAMLTGMDAKELALVDRTLYRDQLKKEIKDQEGKKAKFIEDYGSKKKDVDLSSMAGLLALFSSLSEKKEDVKEDVPRIGLLYASGMIMSGENEESPLLGNVLGDRTTVEALQAIRKDDRIKALVMRIDSPGGSGLASDMIWREVVLTQKVKPVIVSMSDVAASGGYYIAMAADTIVAQPGTITGSIGVITGKFSLGGLYEKIGLDVEIIDRGKNASLFSATSTFSETEREVVMKQMADFYRDFVTKAARGRKMTYEEIDRVAQGRVWTGTQALEIGLVDVLGGMDVAMNIAREKAGIGEDEEFAVIEYPKKKPFFEYLEKMFGGGLVRVMSPEAYLLSSLRKDDMAGLMRAAELFRGQSLFYLMPYSIRLVF